MEATSSGLSQALALPVTHGYFEVLGGVASLGGPFGRAELGYHPTAHLAIFGQGSFQAGAFMAAAGARGDF